MPKTTKSAEIRKLLHQGKKPVEIRSLLAARKIEVSENLINTVRKNARKKAALIEKSQPNLPSERHFQSYSEFCQHYSAKGDSARKVLEWISAMNGDAYQASIFLDNKFGWYARFITQVERMIAQVDIDIPLPPVVTRQPVLPRFKSFDEFQTHYFKPSRFTYSQEPINRAFARIGGTEAARNKITKRFTWHERFIRIVERIIEKEAKRNRYATHSGTTKKQPQPGPPSIQQRDDVYITDAEIEEILGENENRVLKGRRK